MIRTPFLKKFYFLIITSFLILPLAKSQSTYIIHKQEITQILDKFLYLSNLPGHFRDKGYIVKLVLESQKNTFSLAITSITNMVELPMDSIVCLKYKDNCFFTLFDNSISLDASEFDSLSYFEDSRTIRMLASKLWGNSHGLMSFPTIMVFKAQKENRIFRNRQVSFETFHPISTLSKKYWPVKTRVSSIIDEPFIDYLDRKGNPTEQYIEYLENGKGKFRIRTNYNMVLKGKED